LRGDDCDDNAEKNEKKASLYPFLFALSFFFFVQERTPSSALLFAARLRQEPLDAHFL